MRETGPPTSHPAGQDKFPAARQELSAALVERNDEIDLVLTARVAGEHMLLVGPPRNEKSLLPISVARWGDSARVGALS